MEDYKKTNYCTQIQVIRDGQVIKSLIFNQDKIIIGRILSVDLVVDDISISRIHAAIDITDEGKVMVSDLGSVNGVQFKGDKVTEVEVSSGDIVTVGDLDLRITLFKEEEISESPQPRAPVLDFYSELEDIVELKKKAANRTMVVTPKEGGSLSINTGLTGIYPVDRTRDRATVLEGVLFLNDSVLEVKHLKQPRSITIGGHSTSDFYFAPELLPRKFKVITHVKGKYFISIKDEMRGFVQKGGSKNISLDEIKRDALTQVEGDTYTFPMGYKDIVRLEVGNASFLFMFVEQSEPLARKQLVEPDPPYHTSLFASFLIHLLMVLIFQNAEIPQRVKLERIEDRFVKLIIQKKKPVFQEKIRKQMKEKIVVKKKPKPKPKPKLKPKPRPKPKKIAKKRPVQKKLPKPKKVQVSAAQPKKSVIVPDKKRKKARIISPDGVGKGDGFRRKAKKNVKSVGILGALKKGGRPGSLSKLFGKRGIGRGRGVNVIGPRGVKGGRGNFGLKRVSGGVGSTFGIGSGNVLGGGGGGTPGVVNASGALRGRGGVSLSAFNKLKGSKFTGTTSMSESNTVVMGSLSREEIWAVVEKHFSEIQNCYEVALQGDKKLKGKVLMYWVIGANGRVQTVRVRKTTLRNIYTETCMKNRIKYWVFPKPRGGGVVRVTFPFSFKPL